MKKTIILKKDNCNKLKLQFNVRQIIGNFQWCIHKVALCPLFPSQTGNKKCWFLRREKSQNTPRKSLEAVTITAKTNLN